MYIIKIQDFLRTVIVYSGNNKCWCQYKMLNIQNGNFAGEKEDKMFSTLTELKM